MLRTPVLVIRITVLNDTNSCVNDMTVVLVIRTVNFLRSGQNRAEQWTGYLQTWRKMGTSKLPSRIRNWRWRRRRCNRAIRTPRRTSGPVRTWVSSSQRREVKFENKHILIMSYSILDACLCISPLTIVSNCPPTHAGLQPYILRLCQYLTASMLAWVIKGELERIWKEVIVSCSEYYPGTCL